MQDTLYIAEPLFSAKLLEFDSEASFPSIKKIGITTGAPQKREKELLGTVSPVKVAIRKAWGGINAPEVESMLHNILNNSRLDGEYFWDGNETLIDAVTTFIDRYYPGATVLIGEDDNDVKSAEKARDDSRYIRIVDEVAPALEQLGVKYEVTKNKRGVRIYLGDYALRLGTRGGDKYTMNVLSTSKSVEDALADFPGVEVPNFRSDKDPEEHKKKAVMGMRHLDEIMDVIKNYIG